ncbi:LLM class flavin-dependent oxidoreductase [Halosolutus amylolyticus]|uniref:LLM class flavin-dependent oxidoreductase n=1 Tax=Halosolutus amylolyticus TaxID=2932267 RepID=A0ABD5PIW4_9EURY|nr:LLM class flavin-dependent oxidoreductase [Halosolutus amylolyticus]
MKIGISFPSFARDEFAVPPERLKQFAQTVEENGFGGLWMPEHLVRPPTYKTSFMDPLTTVAEMAGATERLPLGTGILILPLRNPVLLAKRVATVQYLSSCRVTLGVGLGYNEAEFDSANVPFEERSSRFTEGIELLYRLLHEEEVTFDGDYYQVENLTITPRLNRPPEILLAGSGVDREDGSRFVPMAIKERMRFADGWLAPGLTADELEHDWKAFASYLKSENEDPAAYAKLAVSYTHLVPNADTELAKERQLKVYQQHTTWPKEHYEENYIIGSIEDVRDGLKEYEKQGFDQVIALTSAHDLDGLDRQLDLWPRHYPEYF